MKLRDIPNNTVVRLKRTGEVLLYRESENGIAECFSGIICVGLLDIEEVTIVDDRLYWDSPDVSSCFMRDLRG